MGIKILPGTDYPMPPIEKLEKYFSFLNKLRESGKTNMWEARPYLMKKFKMDSGERAGGILSLWMKTFDKAATPLACASEAYKLVEKEI